MDTNRHLTIFNVFPATAAFIRRYLTTSFLARLRLPRLPSRMIFPLLMFSASYLLLDAVAAFIISRLIYLGFRNTLERISESIGTRLQARLASRTAATNSGGNLLQLGSTTWPSGAPIVPSTQWNGGGIGGTNLPDSNSASRLRSRLRPFVPRHFNNRAGQQEEGGERNRDVRIGGGGGGNLLSVVQRRDWIAVTDPERRIEVPVYPEISSLVNVLTYEALDTRIGHRLTEFTRWAGAFFGVNFPVDHPDLFGNSVDVASNQTSNSTTSPSTISTMSTNGEEATIFRQLPEELISHILLLAASPSFSPHEPRSCPTNILLLSRRYYSLIVPRLYHSVSLHTPASFRSFRVTLALHNPALGKYVRRLQIGSSEFDSSGYCPSALADHGPLAVGIEQMLLASPHLQELSLDLFSMGALHTGTVSKLEKGPQPTRLCTELTTIPYLSLPTFEDLRELELLVFGMDAATAGELRVTLPILEKLELRLVTRRRGPAFTTGRDTWSPTQLPTLDDYDETDAASDPEVVEENNATEADLRRSTDNADIFQLETDMQDFIEALHLLSTWPGGDERMGKRLQEITVYAWPGAVRG